MAISVGQRLATYEVLSLLGKGGMGEVYRARDTKLDRDVAIKTLPEEFAQDSDRAARFEREAKLLASVNHPNTALVAGDLNRTGSDSAIGNFRYWDPTRGGNAGVAPAGSGVRTVFTIIDMSV